jgi:hypothetical protein
MTDVGRLLTNLDHYVPFAIMEQIIVQLVNDRHLDSTSHR